MQAIRIHEFGEPTVMRMEEITDPAVIDGHVVVDIKAIGVNPVDTYIRAGWYGSRKFPFTPGFDAAGTVLEVGKNIETVSIGQRVFLSGSITGTYAQQAVCKASQVHYLPESVTFEKGAAIGIPYRTAYRALFQRGDVQKGEIVLIHGASGGVGIASFQFAKAAGLKIIATAGSDSGLDLAAQQGADLVVNHYDSAHLEQIIEFTDGQGVDIILEMLANVNLANDLKILAKHGRVVVIGSRGRIEIDPRDLMSREAGIMGVMSNLATPDEQQESFNSIQSGLQEGSLDPLVAIQLPLSQATEAHRKVMDSGHHGKIVLIP